MEKRLVLLFVFLLGIHLASAGCPYTHGNVVKYCHVDITPDPPVYNKDIQLNVTVRIYDESDPIEEGTEAQFWYYNKNKNLTEVKLETDSKGIVRFTPEVMGYHLIKVCGKNILIYVNSTCGDGICAGGETKESCVEDCSSCGDGVCDPDENLNCSDCAVCGDGQCSLGENKSNCFKDCIICGDGVCDYLENRGTCPDDCESAKADNYCDGENDEKCDPDCGIYDDPDCKVETEMPVITPKKVEKTDDSNFTILMIIMVVLIAVATVVLLKKRSGQKNKKSPENTKDSDSKKKAKAKVSSAPKP